MNTADAHGRYQEAVYRGNVYFITASAITLTGYTGGSGGTPALSIYNPANSGKNFVLLSIGIANRVAASGAGTVSWQIWTGPSANITGTLTAATNMLSQAASGSAAKASVNNALTSSTALSNNFPLMSYYWATAAAAATTGPTWYDIGGQFIVAPGNNLTLGGTSALASATWDCSMIWEEIAV
jgi:hypothetical protein